MLLAPIVTLIALASAGAAVLAAPGTSGTLATHLNGTQEVPSRETPAQGQLNLKLSADGESIGFRLIVANIENVVAAHIHCAPAGVNGPVGVTLYSGGLPGSGRTQGVLAHGQIVAPDTGNGCGWESIEDVADAILAGDTYVNVHTNDGVAPTNTGPGDFPGGEIRGQIAAK